MVEFRFGSVVYRDCSEGRRLVLILEEVEGEERLARLGTGRSRSRRVEEDEVRGDFVLEELV